MVALAPHVTLLIQKELFLPLCASPHGPALHLHQPTSKGVWWAFFRILENQWIPSTGSEFHQDEGIQNDIYHTIDICNALLLQHSTFLLFFHCIHVSLSLLEGLFSQVVFTLSHIATQGGFHVHTLGSLPPSFSVAHPSQVPYALINVPDPAIAALFLLSLVFFSF